MKRIFLVLVVATFLMVGGCATRSNNDNDTKTTKVHLSQEVRQAAILGCKPPQFQRVKFSYLADPRSKAKRPDIGSLRLFKSEEANSTVWCATTTSGSRTTGRWKYAFVQLAWYSPGDTKVEWPQAAADRRLKDGDQTKHYVGGMAIPIPAGQCLAVRGFMVWKGHEYWRSVMTDECG